jgi:hypothetical protein
MPAVEVVAVLLIGLTLVWIVFEPLVVEQPRSLPSLDPPELEATPHGAALVALKDLEFDYATGKLSATDYAELQARYTTAAVSSLRQSRGESHRSLTCPGCGPRPEQDALFCSGCGRRLG